MGIRKLSTDGVINISVITIGTVTIAAAILEFKPIWSVNIGTLLVSSLEATRLNMSRDALTARFGETSEQAHSNKSLLGLFTIIPFILFLPFMAKLLLVAAATLFSAYEAVKPVR